MTPGAITGADDAFHPPVGGHPYWTETCYWSFDLPERALSLAVYPLFRPNQGVCSLAVHLWDDTGVAPWEVPYSRFLWHVPMPTSDLTDLDVEGLRLTAEKPLQRYHLEYADGDRVRLDLEYEALSEPFGSTVQMAGGAAGGHYDQALRVRGEVRLGGERIAVDTFGHRDRSWYDRPDNQPRRSASISFGTAADGDHFLVLRPTTLLGLPDEDRPPSGYLVLGDVVRPVVAVERRVVARERGMPREIELALTDAEGRSLALHGKARNNFAFHCSPPVFAWFTQLHWTGGGRDFVGEDQEAHGFDRIARQIAGDGAP